jgi:hypothetical protein
MGATEIQDWQFGQLHWEDCQKALKSFQQRASKSFQLMCRVIDFQPPFFVA